ncbi:MAG: helicase RepA family protein [Chloroflexota bacterium]|nr:helicase RepA family protein [Chloroflexota bacterium]
MSDAFQPLSLDALFALDLAEPDWTVDRLLPLGAAALLSAREKAGKGLLTIDLCACVATGEPFLDRAVREGTAIYCAAEEHVRDVRARIAARLGHRRDAPLYVLPLDGSTDDRLKLEDPGTMVRLAGMIAAHEPVLIVLDTLRELHDGQEDSSDDMVWRLRPVRQMAHQTNTTILVNHHQNKLGGFRGSTAIRAAFDLEWAFNRTDGDGDGPATGKLQVEGRHGPRETVHVRLGDGLRWEPANAVPLLAEPNIRERIIAHLGTTNGAKTAKEIADGLGAAPKTVQNALAEMAKDEPHPVAIEGAGTKNDPRRYRSLSPTLWPVDGEDEGAAMITPASPPLKGQDGGNHPRLFEKVVPDASGNNGKHSGSNGWTCLDCGAPLVADGSPYYCPACSPPVASAD